MSETNLHPSTDLSAGGCDNKNAGKPRTTVRAERLARRVGLGRPIAITGFLVGTAGFQV